MSTDKMNIKKLNFEPHPMGGGIRAIHKFDNGYGASIISGPYSYGGSSGLYELAVIDAETGSIVYDTPITDDVLGYLTVDDLNEVLEQIENL